MKGQVSTEYLVILAVVLVIALVVVYLVSQSTGLGGGVLETQSQAYWREEPSPLEVRGFSASGTSLTLDMLNVAPETVTLNSITGTGLTAYTTPSAFAAGQSKAIIVTLSATCGTTGTRYSYDNVTIAYQQGAVNKTFVGQKPLVGTCS